MSTRWRTTENGTFEVVERQGLVGVIFGSLMLFFAGCFLYWLGTAVVELVQYGTWRDLLSSLLGMVVCLLMAALFGVPGWLMALLSKRTLCNKGEGLVRHVTSFGVFRRTREVRLPEIRKVVARFKTTRRTRYRSGSTVGGVEVHTVEIELVDRQRVELAQLGKWDLALELGRQLAGYLGVEFQEATG